MGLILNFDTNIFISGVISPKSNAGKIIQEWQKNSFKIGHLRWQLKEKVQSFTYG